MASIDGGTLASQKELKCQINSVRAPDTQEFLYLAPWEADKDGLCVSEQALTKHRAPFFFLNSSSHLPLVAWEISVVTVVEHVAYILIHRDEWRWWQVWVCGHAVIWTKAFQKSRLDHPCTFFLSFHVHYSHQTFITFWNIAASCDQMDKQIQLQWSSVLMMCLWA